MSDRDKVEIGDTVQRRYLRIAKDGAAEEVWEKCVVMYVNAYKIAVRLLNGSKLDLPKASLFWRPLPKDEDNEKS